jgi:hypothetical protein
MAPSSGLGGISGRCHSQLPVTAPPGPRGPPAGGQPRRQRRTPLATTSSLYKREPRLMWLTPQAFRPGLPTVAHRSVRRRSIPVTPPMALSPPLDRDGPPLEMGRQSWSPLVCIVWADGPGHRGAGPVDLPSAPRGDRTAQPWLPRLLRQQAVRHALAPRSPPQPVPSSLVCGTPRSTGELGRRRPGPLLSPTVRW